jgi:hypothetical protein
VLFFCFNPDTTQDYKKLRKWEVRSTARHAIHLQFDISANAFVIRTVVKLSVSGKTSGPPQMAGCSYRRPSRTVGERMAEHHSRSRPVANFHPRLTLSHCANHRLNINRPTKRGKEKSPSDGHCQCKKEMDDDLLACQQIFEKVPHSDTLAKERVSFSTVNDISCLRTPNCHHCYIIITIRILKNVMYAFLVTINIILFYFIVVL